MPTGATFGFWIASGATIMSGPGAASITFPPPDTSAEPLSLGATLGSISSDVGAGVFVASTGFTAGGCFGEPIAPAALEGFASHANTRRRGRSEWRIIVSLRRA